MVLAGAWEASLGRTTQQALGWLLLPLAGLGLSGEAHGIWLAVNRQLIRGASAVVTELLEGLSDRPTDRAANEDVVTFLAVKGSPRFHRPACAFVQGREVIRLRSRDAVSKHEACEVCLP